MTVDFARVVAGLSTAAGMVAGERANLSAVAVIITAAQEATGAAGATFTEYGAEGGRVVAATGVMDFAAGQPVAAELIETDRPVQAFTARVDSLPRQIAEPLLDRGVRVLVGQPVQASGRVVGAAHLYYLEVDPCAGIDASAANHLCSALGSVAGALAHVYCAPLGPPRVTLADDDRSLFLAVTGHELRTPVTVVKGFASMLADRWESLDDPGRRDAARVLMQRADELARLVDRLLGASVGDGAMGWLVRIVAFDLVEALTRAVGDLPAELRRVVRLDLPTGLPLATGDPAVLTSVVAELVTNAVRNTAGPGPAQVEILAGADANTVFIRVCDRGVGIDPSHVERAFEKFWRARRDGEDRGGVGLGLFLVRRLVERQQGWVSLRPRAGGGAIAEVRLPRADGRKRTPVARKA